jgi:hypothetical protein
MVGAFEQRLSPCDVRMSPSARTIVELNIKHYRGLLQSERDPVKWETIVKLLAEEEQKLRDLDNKKK